LVVPGGGPFADAVRAADRQLTLSDDAAHWMAVLAMDQYAYLIVDRLNGGMLVQDRRAIEAALDGERVPVLAPFRWLRETDPLPRSWDVTGDSIAAWVAAAVGARRLVLVKPPSAVPIAGGDATLVDAHFARAASGDLDVVVLAARQDADLR